MNKPFFPNVEIGMRGILMCFSGQGREIWPFLVELFKIQLVV